MDDAVYTPPAAPMSLRLSPTIDDSEVLKEFLTKRYKTSFEYDDDLGPNTYRRMDPYTHIYEFNTGRPYLIKFSSDPIHKGLIMHEWDMYQQLYSFDIQSYFIQGIEGGEFKGCSYTILPFIKAISLEESVKDLSNAKLFTILNTVAEALLYLLSKDICHGDMHSGNILLTSDGVKIIDFDKAGPCDGQMNIGYTSFNGRNAARKDLNFIGVPYNTHTGYFVMTKDIFRKKSISTERIDEIIKNYMKSKHTKDDIEAAYSSVKGVLANLQKGGRRTRRSTRCKLKRRITSSK
jgi:serine/threonine protein kinase